MTFIWEDGYTRIVPILYRIRGMKHQGKSPMEVIMSYRDLKALSTLPSGALSDYLFEIELALAPI